MNNRVYLCAMSLSDRTENYRYVSMIRHVEHEKHSRGHVRSRGNWDLHLGRDEKRAKEAGCEVE